MDVMQWVVKELLKDSECCGCCLGCSKVFAQCAEFVEG